MSNVITSQDASMSKEKVQADGKHEEQTVTNEMITLQDVAKENGTKRKDVPDTI